ncbi:hypothetical protein GH714_020660 [Hevea brasiliensis]|uniref:Protein kinase domain-containing protein n=1 Tax=Hevea brasiliensis TaxID=3981 RepID=A0A6A6MNK6_HEVBR|nr:hypothetical protein GH714_020660 [Hevea brasiliensis]
MAVRSSLSVLVANPVPQFRSDHFETRIGVLNKKTLKFYERLGGRYSSTRLNAAGLSEIEPDLNEDPIDRWATPGIDPEDFKYGEYDDHHTYFEGQEKRTFWELIAEDINAVEPPTGFQGFISWLFLPAVAAGMFFNVPAVEVVNPTLIPTLLDIGQNVIFPIFCKCPNQTQLQNQVNYLISYVFQPSDNLSLVASRFGVDTQSIVDVNGNSPQPFNTIFIPVNRLPILSQPTVAPSVASGRRERKGLITGLAVGLGVTGVLLILISGIWVYREDDLSSNEGKPWQFGEARGFCIDTDDAGCYLIYEYIENGSLHSWLHGNRNEKLNWKTRLRIAVDVANGLQYIHEHTRPRVVHKDIKSSNILLDTNMRAKIANFGLAKSGCNAITMHIVGTQGYIAPEYLTDGVVSTKMDVFSFGVVLLELISGKEAIDEEGKLLWVKANTVWDGSVEKKEKRSKEWMDDVLSEESCSMESVMNVMSVAAACLHRDPSKRPSMVDIVYALCKNDDLFFDISEDGLSEPQVTAR